MIGAVAIVGEGVVGTSAALAIRRAFPHCKVTLFSDRPFADSTSFGPAGIFRLDSDSPQQRKWATETFELWTDLERKYHPTETGVHLVSGHMQTNDRSRLEKQERAMGDIVYNFRWMDSRELGAVFSNPAKFGVHFTAYAAEGRRYVPWLRAQLEQLGGVEFRQERVDSIQQIVDGGQFPVVVNCAGLAAGKLAADGDDQNVYPNRGVAIEVEAPGFSHFYYHDIETFCIPLVGDRLILGTLRQDNCWDKEISEQDRADIWARILELKPTLKGAKTLNEWCGLRPVRKGGVRLEHKLVNRSNGGGGAVHVIHNYGHAGNGFVLSWGCAQEVVRLMNAKMEDM